jgi:hypothetical protein
MTMAYDRCCACRRLRKIVSTRVIAGSRDHTSWTLLLRCGHRTIGGTFDLGARFRALESLQGQLAYIGWLRWARA